MNERLIADFPTIIKETRWQRKNVLSMLTKLIANK